MPKTVLITGCSSGVGRATASQFLDEEWDVYATARDEDDVAKLGEAGCRTAELGSVNYDGEELTVAVATTRREDAGDACTQAVVEVDYRATVAFEHGSPDTVVVTHDRGDGPETVTTTSP